MEIQNLKKLSKRSILIAAALFVVTYALALFIWTGIGIKDYEGVRIQYGKFITVVSSYAAAAVKNSTIRSIEQEDEVVKVTFTPNKFGLAQVYGSTLDIPVSNYGFNVPLTIAIMAAFIPFLKSRRAYIEALLILMFVHFLFIFTYECERLTSIYIDQGYEKPTGTSPVFWPFLWGFVDNLVVRFEPFLVGAYLFFFMMRQNKQKPKKEKQLKKEAKKPSKSKGKKSKR